MVTIYYGPEGLHWTHSALTSQMEGAVITVWSLVVTTTNISTSHHIGTQSESEPVNLVSEPGPVLADLSILSGSGYQSNYITT